ncbi:enterochelin esterase [Ralstonia sp. ASV6]|uniref:enterochelin esterase n=1 Tax=Ralstonia sp. ASV6 TaxID=2795124 RepID=UPI0018EB34CD|nr:enterochelin esterase [Ralstonia sp. ASV6]
MRHALFLLSWALAANVAVAASPAVPVADVAVGQSVNATWQPGTLLPYRVTLHAGDLVQGTLDGPAAALDLLDARSVHVRRLLSPLSLSRSFLFVAPADGVYTLRIDPNGAAVAGAAGGVPMPGARYALRIERIVAQAQQHPAPELPQSPRIRALAEAVRHGTGTDSFWHDVAQSGTPLVEPATAAQDGTPMVLLTFLWRGPVRNVTLLGSPSGNHDALQRLGDTDVWYQTYAVPASTRLSYQLAPNVPDSDAPAAQRRRLLLATLQRDPLNPRRFPDTEGDAYQQKSMLELPGAPPQPWLARRVDVPAGTVTAHRLNSKRLGEARDVYGYRPAGVAPQALLVLFDAHAYLSTVPTPTVLDNLIAEGRIPPTAALILSNPSAAARATQLPPNPAFADFLADELMPWAAAQGLSAPAARTVVAGSSYGGLAAAYAGLRHPERFGLVLSQSGSFWWAPDSAPDHPPQTPGWMMRAYAASPRLPLRFYLEAGQFEDGRGAINIFTTTRHMRDVLRAKGYPVRHAEFASGHDYLQWRGTLACGLIALLGEPSVLDEKAMRACPGEGAGRVGRVGEAG